jgi:4-diphosphocytidyl-2-C-methyl-D-erythritol kinase
MTTVLRAPAKLNLCLYLGQRRDDGLHELCSVFSPLQLADRIVVGEVGEADEVICPALPGPNLVEAALREMRGSGWDVPPLRVEIEKRIPVAAGLGGGSADAAAVLRLAGESVPAAELATGLGADVLSQLEPRFALVGGAGEIVEPLPEPGEFGIVLVPGDAGLSTAEVYAEADRLGLGRDAAELAELADRLRAAAREAVSPLEYADLLVNDLQAAALSLRPETQDALEALAEAGAAAALVTGSGPTAFGLFRDIAAADAAAQALPPGYASALVTMPQR